MGLGRGRLRGQRKFSRFQAWYKEKIIIIRYGPAKQGAKHFYEVHATYKNY